MYPYERAKKLVVEIRKLGVNEQGKTFLDLFRILITEIGNALGYVRMVRSAAMYYCSEAVKFLPGIIIPILIIITIIITTIIPIYYSLLQSNSYKISMK